MMVNVKNRTGRIRWKSDRFELERGEDSHWYWLMLATDRKTRIPLSRAEVNELRDLLDLVLQEQAPDDHDTRLN